MNQALVDMIDRYEAGGATLRQAVAGLSREELLAAPIPGKWSTQQVVLHVADAEAAFADRMRRIIAEDRPMLLAWDENHFAARLHYEEQSVEDALEIIALTRRQIARILRALPDADFNRTGQHSVRGGQSLRDVMGFATAHLEHHLKFILEKRKALGK
jgi:uncharacterized damage-inducible protein DinB